MKLCSRSSVGAINIIFSGLILVAVLVASFTGKLAAVSEASFEAAKAAVQLAINLVGIMALWLGLMRILEAGGFMHSLARLIRPLMCRLFPDVPAEHPAMSAMVLNISANMLGLGNAATPFGLRAMQELDRLNPFKGTATNAMCLFLAMNTSSLALLPLGVIGVRAAAGSVNPAGIFLPTLLATTVSTVVAVLMALWLASRDRDYLSACAGGVVEKTESTKDQEAPSYSHLLVESGPWLRWLGYLSLLTFAGAFLYQLIKAEDQIGFLKDDFAAQWLMPFLILLIVAYGLIRGVKTYEAVTEGAKQGFEIAIRIIPFLVAILVAIALFRASGAMDLLSLLLGPLTQLIGMPVDVLPMAILRPLSGSGAFAVMSSLVEAAPDSYSAFLASVMMGSTETTFYVLAVYFGSVGVIKVRHAIFAALTADVAGILAACLFSSYFYSGNL